LKKSRGILGWMKWVEGIPVRFFLLTLEVTQGQWGYGKDAEKSERGG